MGTWSADLPSAHEWHRCCHDRHKQDIGLERKLCHGENRLCRMLHIHAWLGYDCAMRLKNTVFHPGSQIRGGISDVDLAACNLERPAVQRCGLSQSGNRVFRAGVRCGVWTWRMSRDRTVVDDTAALRHLPFHHPNRFLGTKKHTGQIHIDHTLPLLKRQIFDGDRGSAGAGVVEQHVETAEFVVSLSKETLNVIGIRNVRWHDKSLCSSGRLRLCLQKTIGPASRQNDAPSLAKESESRSFSDSAAGARDDRCFHDAVLLRYCRDLSA